jgi:hypothetical protein
MATLLYLEPMFLFKMLMLIVLGNLYLLWLTFPPKTVPVVIRVPA